MINVTQHPLRKKNMKVVPKTSSSRAEPWKNTGNLDTTMLFAR
jgi:hypothetical protein